MSNVFIAMIDTDNVAGGQHIIGFYADCRSAKDAIQAFRAAEPGLSDEVFFPASVVECPLGVPLNVRLNDLHGMLAQTGS